MVTTLLAFKTITSNNDTEFALHELTPVEAMANYIQTGSMGVHRVCV